MNGLSTLNRLLGKKNKEASRSTSNLSKSSNSLETSSQQNKISPIVNNAPFEQTFRVTVYLPKNQLYVERIGAKTKLATLMNKICESKVLTPDKYEFRHPGDMSQAFDNNKTIGEVGLNELKLVLKTESRFNSDFHRFHADDMLKYKSNVADSVSSSEISRNYSKNTVQKPSPYSSTTSLNSLDSTGMNLTAKTQPPVAPLRKKKRVAPRPPSQNSIPEQEIFGTTLNVFKEPHSILPRKNFHVSSPQLTNNNIHQEVKSDRNNNNIEAGNRLNAIMRPTSLYVTSTTEINQNGSASRQRTPSESSEVQHILHERRNSNSLERKKKPAPIPPKRVQKPVPSPRTVQEESKPPTITEIKEIDENENLQLLDNKFADHVNSANVSKTLLNNAPTSEELPSIESSDGPVSIQIISSDNSEHDPSPKLPAVSKVIIKPEEERRSSSEDEMTVKIYNVTNSTVRIEKPNHVAMKSPSEEKNISITVERKESQKSEKPVERIIPVTLEKAEEKTQGDVKPEKGVRASVVAAKITNETTYMAPLQYEDQESAKIVSRIQRESKSHVPIPSPRTERKVREIPVKVEERTTVEEHKILKKFSSEPKTVPMAVESRSDPEIAEQRSPVSQPKVIHEIPIKIENQESVNRQSEQIRPKVAHEIPAEVEARSPSPLWTYTLPAPPVFADASVVEKTSPTDHPKASEKVYSEFASTDCNETIMSDSNTTTISAETQIHPIIVDRRPSAEKFIMTTKPAQDDESDKSTEIITSDLEDGYLGNGQVTKEEPSVIEKSRGYGVVAEEIVEPVVKTEPEKNRLDDFKRSRLMIARSDSFHSISQGRNFESSKRNIFQPPQRSTSFLYLNKPESPLSKFSSENASYNRQKSSSELSISDVPSLQSLEVIKNILNSSRKNSLQDVEPIRKQEMVSKPEVKPEEVKKPTRQVSEPLPETKQVETQWRYTGPPKINLTTWSERPKVEVAIAADNDYKFGGVAATLPRDHKHHQDTPSKRHTIHIPNEKVVESSKPKVLTVEYKKDVSPLQAREPVTEIVTKPLRSFPMQEKDPVAEIVTRPSRTLINIKPRPMSMDMSHSYSQLVTSPSAVSYNRLNNNVKKLTPVVHGFKLNNIHESDQVESRREPETSIKKVITPPMVPAKPSFLRSTSSGDINRKMKFSTAEAKPCNTPTIDHMGLRKTGLKEKILENDKQTESIFGRVVDSKNESFIRHERNHEIKPENNTMRSLSHPAPPAPPPPMNFRKSEPVNLEDTKSQLLDAIKNFNKDSLRNRK